MATALELFRGYLSLAVRGAREPGLVDGCAPDGPDSLPNLVTDFVSSFAFFEPYALSPPAACVGLAYAGALAVAGLAPAS